MTSFSARGSTVREKSPDTAYIWARFTRKIYEVLTPGTPKFPPQRAFFGLLKASVVKVSGDFYRFKVAVEILSMERLEINLIIYAELTRNLNFFYLIRVIQIALVIPKP